MPETDNPLKRLQDLINSLEEYEQPSRVPVTLREYVPWEKMERAKNICVPPQLEQPSEGTVKGDNSSTDEEDEEPFLESKKTPCWNGFLKSSLLWGCYLISFIIYEYGPFPPFSKRNGVNYILYYKGLAPLISCQMMVYLHTSCPKLLDHPFLQYLDNIGITVKSPL